MLSPDVTREKGGDATDDPPLNFAVRVMTINSSVDDFLFILLLLCVTQFIN
jgi:hypothetical protein